MPCLCLRGREKCSGVNTTEKLDVNYKFNNESRYTINIGDSNSSSSNLFINGLNNVYNQ
jgi:hypothetical protein